jgi:hypothetical protein
MVVALILKCSEEDGILGCNRFRLEGSVLICKDGEELQVELLKLPRASTCGDDNLRVIVLKDAEVLLIPKMEEKK